MATEESMQKNTETELKFLRPRIGTQLWPQAFRVPLVHRDAPETPFYKRPFGLEVGLSYIDLTKHVLGSN